jgi:hypothetical protein
MRSFYYLIFFGLCLVSCRIQNLSIQFSEVSGIEQIERDLYVLINDSGDGPYLYIVDSKGNIKKKVFVKGAKNVDWEDITFDGRNTLYVGDIGNNLNKRKDLAIYKIEIRSEIKPHLLFQDTIHAVKFSYQYPDQEQFPPEKDNLNFDSEALTYADGKLYILSKNRTVLYNRICKVYECEFENDKLNIRLIQQVKLKGITWLTGSVTGCDYSNGMLYVLTYKRIYIFEQHKEGFKKVKTKLVPFQQWEGICVDSNNTLRIVAEKSRLGNQKMKTIKLWN